MWKTVENVPTQFDIDEELFSSAHNLAKEMKRKTCLIYGGTPMTRLVASRWKTQINENWQTIAVSSPKEK